MAAGVLPQATVSFMMPITFPAGMAKHDNASTRPQQPPGVLDDRHAADAECGYHHRHQHPGCGLAMRMAPLRDVPVLNPPRGAKQLRIRCPDVWRLVHLCSLTWVSAGTRHRLFVSAARALGREPAV